MPNSPKPVTIAYHGKPGAWSEAAAYASLGGTIETLACANPHEVFLAVEEDRVQKAIVPIEHSLTGGEHRTYDLLLEHPLHIIGEIYYPIVHCLIVHPGIELPSIRRLYSHPQVFEQCRSFLNGLPGVRLHTETDTGGAVERIKRRGFLDAGALASERAAEIYGMSILVRGVEDPPSNVTRFVILGKEVKEPKRRAKTSFVFAVQDLTRQFFSCISLFALRDLPLTKIESRPVRRRPGHHLFFVDVSTGLSNPALEQALSHLRELAPWVRVLGCYPAASKRSRRGTASRSRSAGGKS